MVLAKTMKKVVGKRDSREAKIEELLKKSLEECPGNGFTGRKYLSQAVAIKEDIHKERGEIYFHAYPEILRRIDAIVSDLVGRENGSKYKF